MTKLTTILFLLILAGCNPKERECHQPFGKVTFDTTDYKLSNRVGGNLGYFAFKVLSDSLTKNKMTGHIWVGENNIGWDLVDGSKYEYPYTNMPDWINKRVIQIHLQDTINLLNL